MNGDFLNKISTISELDPEALKRSGKDFQFTDIANEISNIILFYRNFNQNLDFYNSLPESSANSLVGETEQIFDVLNSINVFDPTKFTDPSDERNKLSNTIKTKYNALFPFINHLDVFRLVAPNAQAEFVNLTKEAKNALNDVKVAKRGIENLLKSSEVAAQKVGLKNYGGEFNRLSRDYNGSADRWLAMSAVAVVVLAGLLFWVSAQMSMHVAELNTFQGIVTFVATKLFFVAIGIYLLQQFIRNYLANKHLKVIYEQRETSLKVFPVLIDSVQNEDAKNQIVLYASKSIFEAAKTGFFPGKDSTNGGPDLLGVFKDISKPK